MEKRISAERQQQQQQQQSQYRPDPQPSTVQVQYISAFRLFTKESMTKIERRIQEERNARQQLQHLDNDGGAKVPGQSAGNDTTAPEDRPEPNPLLAAGNKLPAKLGDFPSELYGKPIEDVDEFYKNQYVSISSL